MMKPRTSAMLDAQEKSRKRRLPWWAYAIAVVGSVVTYAAILAVAIIMIIAIIAGLSEFGRFIEALVSQ